MEEQAKVLEHLKMIQQTVTRMSSAMLSVKMLGLTTFGLLSGLAVKENSIIIHILAFIVLIAFSLLDMFYLWQEKLYRRLYEKIRTSCKTNFSMETDDLKKECRITDSIKSPAICLFYGTLFFIDIILFFYSVLHCSFFYSIFL